MEEYQPKAIYEFIRALVTDPSLGGTQDAKKMGDMLTNTYVNYHGGSEGLDELKQQAKATPLPPGELHHRERDQGGRPQAEGVREQVPAAGDVARHQEPARRRRRARSTSRAR